MVRELRAGRDRQRAAMQRMEAVGIHVVGRFPRTADAGNHRDSMWRDLQLKERMLDRAQDSEIATAGTPIDVDLSIVLLQAEFLGRGDRLRHAESCPPSCVPTTSHGLHLRSRSAGPGIR